MIRACAHDPGSARDHETVANLKRPLRAEVTGRSPCRHAVARSHVSRIRLTQGTVIEVSATASYTGSLVGTSTINGTLIVHADGSASYHDVEVFTGT
jgi:hypothetical protein